MSAICSIMARRRRMHVYVKLKSAFSGFVGFSTVRDELHTRTMVCFAHHGSWSALPCGLLAVQTRVTP